MTAPHSTASTVLVAIDISKHRHEVHIGIPGKKRRRRMTITNTLEDFQRLAIALASYELPVRIGFEATGNYHRALAHVRCVAEHTCGVNARFFSEARRVAHQPSSS